MPFLVSLNAHVLYPTELLSLPFGLNAATFFAADAILHLWWAGAGMYALLRAAGRAAAAAFTGALAFELGQHLFGLTAIGIPWIRDVSWLPWTFVCLESLRAGGGTSWALAGGVTLGLPVLTAGVQYAAFVWPAAAAWLLAGSVADRRRAAARLAALTATAAALSAILWLPAAEYYRHSVRSTPELYKVPLSTQASLLPEEWITFLIPDFFGYSGAFFGPRPFPISSDAFGLLPLVLACAGLAAAWRSDARFAWLAGAGALLALGSRTPLGSALASLPLLAAFRSASRWLMLAQLGLAWFAARGWADLAVRRRRALGWAVPLIVLAGTCVVAERRSGTIAADLTRREFVARHVAWGDVAQDAVAPTVAAALRSARSAALGGAAALTLAGASAVPLGAAAAAAWAAVAREQFATAARRVKFAPRGAAYTARPDLAAWLSAAGRSAAPPRRMLYFASPTQPNQRMAYGVHSVFGYHGLPPTRAVLMYLLASTPPPLGHPGCLELLDAAWDWTAGPVPAGWTRSGTLADEEGRALPLWTAPAPRGRVYTARTIVPCDDADGALAVLRDPAWTPAIASVDPPPNDPLPARFGDAARIQLAWGRDEITAEVEASEPVLLLFAETWYPAWKGFVDGARVPILRANVSLRGVAVPPGRHAVRMLYDSGLFKLGLWISFAAGALLPLLLARYAGTASPD